jgi:hypothetical protein
MERILWNPLSGAPSRSITPLMPEVPYNLSLLCCTGSVFDLHLVSFSFLTYSLIFFFSGAHPVVAFWKTVSAKWAPQKLAWLKTPAFNLPVRAHPSCLVSEQSMDSQSFCSSCCYHWLVGWLVGWLVFVTESH